MRVGLENPVPDLIRDLVGQRAGGPGSSPGRGALFVNHAASCSPHATLCLHYGFTPRRRALYRANQRLACTGRGPSRRAVGTYSSIQHKDVGLVRRTLRFRGVAQARTGDQAVAARLERCAHYRAQSGLDRYHALGSLILTLEVPDQVRDASHRGASQ